MIKVENLKKTFRGKNIFENVSFIVNKGEKIGLIGVNGSGKTTILKIIMGEIEADEGKVIIDKNEKIGYLPQTIEANFEETIKEFFSENNPIEDWKIKKYLGKLGIENISLERKIKSFSGGEITKIALARVLMQEPTMLLLDEPTNNLDIKGIIYLKRFLTDFKGGVLLISHDRWLLDQLVTKIIDLQFIDEKVISKIYHGNFSSYEEIHQKEIEKQETLYELQQKEIKKTEKNIQKLMQKANKMETSFSKRKKDKSIGMLDLSKGSKLNRMAKAGEKRIKMLLESDEKVKKPQKDKCLNFYFGNFLEKGQRVLIAKDIVFFFDKEKILNEINFEIYGKDKIALLGPNGSGKTTFIKILLNKILPKNGEIKWNSSVKIGYLPQEIIFSDPQKTALEEFEKNLKIPESESRRILGKFLFSGEDQMKKLQNLSLGEKRRLYLAKLVASGSNFLLLDEPTNYLDIKSVRAIEKALSIFEGAIFVISHDRYFLKNIGIKNFYYLEEGKFQEFYSIEDLEKLAE